MQNKMQAQSEEYPPTRIFILDANICNNEEVERMKLILEKKFPIIGCISKVDKD
jgi:hypothetical protein